MTTITNSAYSLLGDHDALTTALDSITRESRTNNQSVPPAVEIDFVDLALAGEPFPLDVTSAGDDRLRAIHNIQIRGEKLKAAKAQVERLRTEAVQDHADKALAYLDHELQELISEVVDTADSLGSLSDVQRILEAGTSEQIKAWRNTTKLVERYIEIRSAQVTITRQCLDAGQLNFIYEAGFLRNSLDDSAFWNDQRSQAYTPRAAHDQDDHVVRYNNWLTNCESAKYPHKREVMPVSNDQHIAYLLDVCTNSQLWVPSIGKLLAAWNAANSAAQPVSFDRLKGMEESRNQYYEITGTTPTSDYSAGGQDGYRKAPNTKKSSLGESYLSHIS
ncbi:hypothetical protein [Arthrobacter sp. H35-D1]|uniref:hypothetical protein n=1 Tax=Arthrobacter sp. H35-D1 TaxID=3046202 RepID=UPI0024BB64C8|nr:hypothetical protein [Arthrobacter sp. H35-D1]MDJ0315066.1 hypothetical protein [Arthrobacter sp. H35-D1]